LYSRGGRHTVRAVHIHREDLLTLSLLNKTRRAGDARNAEDSMTDAVVFTAPRVVELRRVPAPDPCEWDVQVDMIASGISTGTERWALLGLRPDVTFPCIPGYLGVGVVRRTGAQVTTVKAGDRVTYVAPRPPEGYGGNRMCAHLGRVVVQCDPGLYSAEADMPYCLRVPPEVPAEAAAFAGLAGVSMLGIEMAKPLAAESVAVFGLGLVGQFSAQLAKLAGARVLACDLNPDRANVAAMYGADQSLTVGSPGFADAARAFAPTGFDVIIDTTGSGQALAGEIGFLRPGGRFVFQGWYPGVTGVDIHSFTIRQPRALFPCGMRGAHVAHCLDLMAQGKLRTDALITHRWKPEDAPHVYRSLLESDPPGIGHVFEWAPDAIAAATPAADTRTEARADAMRALVVERPGRLSICKIRKPVVGDYDALVRIHACGICNSTDTGVIDGTMPFHNQYPAVLGHEGVGEIVEVGKKARNLAVGMRFTRPFAILPGETRDGIASAWGGFSDFGIVRDREALESDGTREGAEHFLVKRQCRVPAKMSTLDAALAISLSEVASWMDKTGDVAGKRVVILGTGIAGLAMAFFSRLAGAEKVLVLGRRRERTDHALKCGATAGMLSDPGNVGPAREMLDGGADFLLEAAGDATALARWIPCLRPGGRVSVYGMPPGYAYSIPLSAAPADFQFLVPSPEEHLSYPQVCDLILGGRLDTKLFRSHDWKWPDDVLAAFDAVRRREVLKGFVVFP
jgi:2-desacetyl-2-hydroxyethyl bacteriochlorophyllide A dehydrogenase